MTHRNTPRCRRRQLAQINEKISEFADAKPESHPYGVFAMAARLARKAAATALALRGSPGAESTEFEPLLSFWLRFSDYAGAAALNCIGGNQTLAEALVTHQFLLTARERKEEETDAS
jgi:hypothetical protein